ncbi:MAG TPA: hypothetical protein VG454_03060 [Gemmatimonadales bacterium]|nr:hypothetical protein [Gemmatimonadales bacterium]
MRERLADDSLGQGRVYQHPVDLSIERTAMPAFQLDQRRGVALDQPFQQDPIRHNR